MASADPKRQTRSTDDLLDPDNDFPAISKFKDPKKLPLCSDIIGVLKTFYQTLHDQLNTEITADFFKFDDPWFDCINLELFKDVHQSYNENVVSAVKRISAQYLDDCLKLVNIILPELKTVLARQRQDYGSEVKHSNHNIQLKTKLLMLMTHQLPI